jgi:hypothetical protein|tara:strand:+ start:8236 stop:8430 length:195 start_codon:yes stop_codon:yes gene_type:complete
LPHLFAIHSSLRVGFPSNRDRADRRPKAPNRAFDNRSHVEIMLEQGRLPGILANRRYLDDIRNQ